LFQRPCIRLKFEPAVQIVAHARGQAAIVIEHGLLIPVVDVSQHDPLGRCQLSFGEAAFLCRSHLIQKGGKTRTPLQGEWGKLPDEGAAFDRGRRNCEVGRAEPRLKRLQF
jgi:hypothetical protein